MKTGIHPMLGMIAAFLTTAPVAFAQTDSPAESSVMDVSRALDRVVPRLTIEEAEVPAALARIGEQAGITIRIDDRSAELLPWGRQTRLKQVTVENASLREVLPKILGALGMTYRLGNDEVVVMATRPLSCMFRRATWDDLKLLARCNELEYTPENFESLRIQYRITSKVDAPRMLMDQLAKAGRGRLAELLDVATGGLGWVWFPNGDHIVVRTQQAQIANYMSRRISQRYCNMPLSRILVDLAAKAETPINFEPGMMLKLPPATAQSYTLLLQNTSIRQAFELISAETGLTYKIRRSGIDVGLAEQVPGSAQPSLRATASPYVGKITIPSADGSYAYDFVLRADELPEDILEYRRQIIEEYIQKMRNDMAPDNAIRSPGSPE